jgi:hypothetical protein
VAELEIVFAGTRLRLASAAQRVQTLVKKKADRNQHLALALLNVERYDLVGEFFEARIAAKWVEHRIDFDQRLDFRQNNIDTQKFLYQRRAGQSYHKK